MRSTSILRSARPDRRARRNRARNRDRIWRRAFRACDRRPNLHTRRRRRRPGHRDAVIAGCCPRGRRKAARCRSDVSPSAVSCALPPRALIAAQYGFDPVGFLQPQPRGVYHAQRQSQCGVERGGGGNQIGNGEASISRGRPFTISAMRRSPCALFGSSPETEISQSGSAPAQSQNAAFDQSPSTTATLEEI